MCTPVLVRWWAQDCDLAVLVDTLPKSIGVLALLYMLDLIS